MADYLWEHNLRSRETIVAVLVHLALDCILFLLYMPLLTAIAPGVSLTGDMPERLILPLFLVLMQVFHYASSTRYLLLEITIRYGISATHVHFHYGLLRRVSKAIPVRDIVNLHKLTYDHVPWATLLIVTEPPTDVQGYDFESHETRPWASIERVEDPDSVVQLIRSLRRSAPNVKSEQARTSLRDLPLWQRRITARVTRYVGALYLALCLLFGIYALDVMTLSPKVVEDRVVDARRLLSGDGDEHVGRQATARGYVFRTYSLIAAKDTDVTLKVSPLFGVVTDFQKNDRSYRSVLITGLNGVQKYAYFITFFVILACGIAMLRKRGMLDIDTLLIAYFAPILLLCLCGVIGYWYGL